MLGWAKFSEWMNAKGLLNRIRSSEKVSRMS
jgi:hypothetical protein